MTQLAITGVSTYKENKVEIGGFVDKWEERASAYERTAANAAGNNDYVGIIDEDGNPVVYDYSNLTDVDEKLGIGVTFGLGGALGRIGSMGKMLGMFKGGGGKNEDPIVIGETMQRVVKYAEENGFDYYRSRTKNSANYMSNNKSWIQGKIKQGRNFIDIGRDSEKVSNNKSIGDYYKMEKGELKKYNYPVSKIKIK